jgi:ribosome-associated protein
VWAWGPIQRGRDSSRLACHTPRVRTLEDRRREQAKADADDRELESRTDRRRQQDAQEARLKALAVRLVSSKPAALDRLGLDEELAAAIATARVIRSAPARNRQINVVRQHLRAFAPAALEALLRSLDERASGRAASAPTPARPVASVPLAPPPTAAQRWLERLADEGDAALEALVSEHPSGDRQALRQYRRELARARAEGHAPSVARAEARLLGVLEPLLASAARASSHEPSGG